MDASKSVKKSERDSHEFIGKAPQGWDDQHSIGGGWGKDTRSRGVRRTVDFIKKRSNGCQVFNWGEKKGGWELGTGSGTANERRG